MARKKLIKNKATAKELREELNKISTVLWKEMPHEPCCYQRLSATVRRILLTQLNLILEGRGLIDDVLLDPGLPIELRAPLESWMRRTRPYKDDPACNDTNDEYRRYGIYSYREWGDEEEE